MRLVEKTIGVRSKKRRGNQEHASLPEEADKCDCHIRCQACALRRLPSTASARSALTHHSEVSAVKASCVFMNKKE